MVGADNHGKVRESKLICFQYLPKGLALDILWAKEILGKRRSSRDLSESVVYSCLMAHPSTPYVTTPGTISHTHNIQEHLLNIGR